MLRELRAPRVFKAEKFGNSLILEVQLTRACRVEPGQYVNLRLLTTKAMSMVQRHPFAITWWESLDDTSMAQRVFLMIEPRRGWTRRIARHTDSLQDVTVWLDGPYGQPYNVDSFGSVLLFASGSGMFALLPFVKRLTQLVKIAAANTRRIKLIWHTDEYHNQLQEWMQSVLDDDKLEPNVRCEYDLCASTNFCAAA